MYKLILKDKEGKVVFVQDWSSMPEFFRLPIRVHKSIAQWSSRNFKLVDSANSTYEEVIEC